MTPPDFSKYADGLVPTIVQDASTQRVLMLGYMNAEAYERTQDTGLVTFFSRSRQRLWVKGETSGNHLRLRSIHVDCDNDALLVLADPDGPTCHTGAESCFADQDEAQGMLHRLERTIGTRIAQGATEQSYTASLVAKGIHKVAQKVGEEAVEVVIEALRDDRTRLVEETADLLYHMLVLLAAKGVALREVEQVLAARQRQLVM